MRRLFIPETIGTSAMDCGPASLTSLLRGFGIPVAYDRLRDACRTDVDGTSIDRIEDVARDAGLAAEQVMLAPDLITLPAAAALPAIVVTRLPDGRTHFIVVWRRIGRRVQVMDPTGGRRWMTVDALTRSLYVHGTPVPAEAWRAWAESPAHRTLTLARLARLGVTATAAEPLLTKASDDPDWLGWAALDAAIRVTAPLVEARAIRRGTEAVRAVASLADRIGFDAESLVIPPDCWSVMPLDDEHVMMRGAVLVRATGRVTDAPEALPAERETRSMTLAPSRTRSPLRAALGWILADGALGPALIALGMVFSAGMVVAEAALFRGLVDALAYVGPPEQRMAAIAVVVAFMVAMLAVELPIRIGLLRQGRALEMRIRVALRRRLPRLSDRYLRSRPLSDLAERAHGVDGVRGLPGLVAGIMQSAVGLTFTAAGLLWLDPGLWPIVTVTVVVGLAVPMASVPLLAERDLRFRTHTGALTRYALDALLGLVAVRTHGGQRAMRRRHEALLVEWARSALSVERLGIVIEGLLSIAGAGVVGWLLYDHLTRATDTRGVLLVVWWGLALPGRARGLIDALQAWPGARNQLLRILEPLDAPVVEESPSAPIEGERPVGISARGLTVRAGDHCILSDIDLDIAPGEHAAIVGRSGAGKSTLLGALLGLGHETDGALYIDGQPHDAEALRAVTAWVDPSTHLWNRSLLDNLRYASEGTEPSGSRTAESTPIDALLDAAELRPVVGRLPNGLQSVLGEGGGLVSGGEGQRIRLARAMAQPDPRLVLLDEPLRGLDRARRARLLARARDHWADATLICVTHDLERTADFDRVLVIDDGRLVESGTPDALMASDGIYAALMASEAHMNGIWRDDRWHHATLADGRMAS